MLKLHRYFLRQYLFWFSSSVFIIASIIYLFEFSELLRRSSVHSHLDLATVLKMAFMRLPSLIQQLLPFITLLSGALMMRRLQRSQQIVIVRGIGLSFRQIITPFMIGAGLIVAVNFALLNPLAAYSEYALQKIEHPEAFLGSYGHAKLSEQGLWMTQQFSDCQLRILNIKQLDALLNKVHQISIIYFQNHQFHHRIDAQVGEVKDNVCWLQDGILTDNLGAQKKLSHFHLDHFPSISLLITTLQELNTLSFWQLNQSVEALKKIGIDAHKFMLNYQFFLAKNVLIFLMSILAALLTFRLSHRRHGYMALLGAVICGFVLHIFTDITYSMASAKRLSYWVSAWLPVFLTSVSILAGVLYYEEG